jgi:hypothetical protein
MQIRIRVWAAPVTSPSRTAAAQNMSGGQSR